MSENSQTVHFLANLGQRLLVSYNCKPSTKKSEGDINAYKGFRAYDETMRIVIAKCSHRG